VEVLMATVRGRAHHQVTFAVLAFGVGAYALLQSLVIPVLTTIQHDLHTTQDAATWVLTAYLLSASIMTPILGRVGDMFGKKRVFVITLLALGVGSLLAAIAPSIGVMIVARVIQGIGGGMLPVAFGIIRDEFPPDKVIGAVGVIASLTAAGGGLGIVLAGPIVNALDYHWLFWLPMIFTFIAAGCAILFVPESPVRTPGRISWLPALLLSAWLVALLVALSEAPVWGWGSTKVIGLLAAAVVLAAGWVLTELRARTPLIDMKMMRLTAVWTNNLVALLIGMGMYATFAFLPEFVQTPTLAGYGFGASITRSGLMLLPSSFTMFAAGMLAGRLTARFGGKALVVAGCAVGAGSMAILAFAHGQEWEIYVSTGLMGVGFGLAFSAMSALIVGAVPHSQTGVASGMNANIRTIGGSIGSAAMASIVTSRLLSSGLPAQSGYTIGFAVMTGCLVLAALAGLLIPVARRAMRTSDAPAYPEEMATAGEAAALAAEAAEAAEAIGEETASAHGEIASTDEENATAGDR
jgi:EmrB/QacA subfamily drug resistance transporter